MRIEKITKISMLCFSQRGWNTGIQLAEGLKKNNREIFLDGKSRYLPQSISASHDKWTEEHFHISDALIFIGACGIAVRSIAPFVKNKKTDPAVLVVDECGKYVISLLSGHLGGANALTEEAARILGAVPVITTATDLHRQFAVDVFAKENQCSIFPMKAAKEFSAALLAGEPVGFYSDFPWEGRLPDGLVCCDMNGTPVRKNVPASGIGHLADLQENFSEDRVFARPQTGMAVSIQKDCSPFPVTVHIIPRIAAMGVGCRRGKEASAIEYAAQKRLEENGISREALELIASIDLKKDEPGLIALAENWNLPFKTWDSESLKNAAGDFSTSSFVSSVTGVDNVCERSAVLASNGGSLILRKKGKNGVTTALALKDWRICFE